MTITIEKAQHLLAQQPESTKHGLPEVGICVQCLAAYNNGIHHFQWIDLEYIEKEGDVMEAIQWMLASSPVEGAEEYMVSDTVGLPSFLTNCQWPDIKAIEAYGLNFQDLWLKHENAYKALCGYLGEVVEVDRFEEMYLGDQSPEEYVQDLVEQTERIPDSLAYYIDWESMANDWKLNGDLIEVDGMLFNGHA